MPFWCCANFLTCDNKNNGIVFSFSEKRGYRALLCKKSTCPCDRPDKIFGIVVKIVVKIKWGQTINKKIQRFLTWNRWIYGPAELDKSELVGARPLHLACARPFCCSKAPLGLSLLRKRKLFSPQSVVKVSSNRTRFGCHPCSWTWSASGHRTGKWHWQKFQSMLFVAFSAKYRTF